MKILLYFTIFSLLTTGDLEKVIPFEVTDYLGKKPREFEVYCLKNDYRYQVFKTDAYNVIETRINNIKAVLFSENENTPADLIILYYDKKMFQKDSICDVLDDNLALLVKDGEGRATMWIDYPDKEFICRLEEKGGFLILKIQEPNP